MVAMTIKAANNTGECSEFAMLSVLPPKKTSIAAPPKPIRTPANPKKLKGCLKNMIPTRSVKIGVSEFKMPAVELLTTVSDVANRKAGTAELVNPNKKI